MLGKILSNPLVKDVVVAVGPSIYHRFKGYLNSWLNYANKRVENKWDSYAGGAVDNVDHETASASSLVGESELQLDLPNSFRLNNKVVLNQGPTMWCVGVGSTEAHNEGSYLFNTAPAAFPEVVSYIRDNLDDKIDKDGTLILNGPKALKEMGIIDNYYLVRTLHEIKRAIYLGGGFCSGSNKISWSKTGVNGVAVQQSGSGHFINGTGWDDSIQIDDGFGNKYIGAIYVENTWGENWGLKGGYWIPYDILDSVLFNARYGIIVDSTKVEERLNDIINGKQENASDYHNAIELGIISSERPEDNVIRKDSARMNYRVYKMIDERLKPLEDIMMKDDKGSK